MKIINIEQNCGTQCQPSKKAMQMAFYKLSKHYLALPLEIPNNATEIAVFKPL
jgi:hypothetical protein